MYEGSDDGSSESDPKPPDLPNSTARKRFTKEEDAYLKKLAESGDLKNWEDVAKRMPGRTARQCRDRYNNYLFKELTTAPFSPEEDEIILKMHQEIGAKWATIARSLNGRSGNNVKNRWYKFLAKRHSKPKRSQTVTIEITEPEELPLIDFTVEHDPFEDIDFQLF